MRFTIRHANEARTLTCDYCNQLFVIPPDTDDVHIQRMGSRHLELDHGAKNIGSAHFTSGGEGVQIMTITAEVPSETTAAETAADEIADGDGEDAGDVSSEDDGNSPVVKSKRRGSR